MRRIWPSEMTCSPGCEAGTDDRFFRRMIRFVDPQNINGAHGDGLIWIENPNIFALRTGLDSAAGNQQAVSFETETSFNIDEFSWPQRPIGIFKIRFEFDGAGGGVYRVINEL